MTRTYRHLIAASVVALAVAATGCGSDDADDAGPSSPPTTVAEISSGATDGGGDETSSPAVELPDGWPDELALPEGTTLLNANQVANSTALSIDARVEDPQAAFDTLKSQLSDAGYEIVGSTFTPTDLGGYGSISAKGDTYTVAISFGPDPTGDTNELHINVAEPTP
jgi:hypothetical protein